MKEGVLLCSLCQKRLKRLVKLQVKPIECSKSENHVKKTESININAVNLGFESIDHITYDMLQSCLQDTMPVHAFIVHLHFDANCSENMNFRYYRYRRMCIMVNGSWQILHDGDAAKMVYDNALNHFTGLLKRYSISLPTNITNMMSPSMRDRILEVCKLHTEKYKKHLSNIIKSQLALEESNKKQ